MVILRYFVSLVAPYIPRIKALISDALIIILGAAVTTALWYAGFILKLF